VDTAYFQPRHQDGLPDIGAFESQTITALDEANNPAMLRIYPIPSGNILHVSNANSETSYQIYSVEGRLLYSGYFINGSIEISALIPGIYFLQIDKQFQLFIKE
jgi:hypothetical protein